MNPNCKFIWSHFKLGNLAERNKSPILMCQIGVTAIWQWVVGLLDTKNVVTYTFGVQNQTIRSILFKNGVFLIQETSDCVCEFSPSLTISGFCDGDPSNDLTMANGTTLGANQDPAVFIDSWQISNTTGYISHSRRRELNCSTSDCSSCLAMLENQAFRPCHAFVR